jgi:hypothetical protein
MTPVRFSVATRIRPGILARAIAVSASSVPAPPSAVHLVAAVVIIAGTFAFIAVLGVSLHVHREWRLRA